MVSALKPVVTDAAPKMPLLDVRDLHLGFQFRDGMVEALRGIDLSVNCGEIVGIVGESGSGKSLTAFSIMGLLPKTAKILNGTIRVGGTDLLSASARELDAIRGKTASIVFQEPMMALNPTMRIGEQVIEHVSEARDLSRRARRQLMTEVLDKVRMPHPASVIDAYPHELSGGMRQRVVIAAAIAAGPRLVVADEPTTALDVTIQAQIVDLLLHLQRDTGMGLLFITHDLALVSTIAHRVVVMYAGRVVESGKVEDVLRDPQHPYTRGLLDCLPERHGKGEILRVIPGVVPSLRSRVPGCQFQNRCPRATDRCKGEEPRLRDVQGRQVACHVA